MVRWWSLLFGAALLAALVAPVSAQPAGEQRVLIQVANAADRDHVKAGVPVRHDFGAHGFTADLSPAAQAALARRPGVRITAVPEATIDANARAGGKPGSGGGGGRVYFPTAAVPWGIAATYNQSGLTATSGGSGVVVAILDTGVATHLDLAKPAQCKDFSQKRSPLVDGTCKDGNGHGTHVTGTVVAGGGADGLGIWGMAPGASYYAYKVLTDRGSGYYDDIANGIRTAADQGANIINMSLGGSADYAILSDAIAYAADRGVLVVAAAGNSGPSLDTIAYPAAYPQVVAVGALLNDGTQLGVPQYSSRGVGVWGDNPTIDAREVEVAAPGSGVESTWSNGGYNTISGTSMASPHITGLAAKAWQGSAAATRAWLQSQAALVDVTVGEHTGVGYDPAAGYGFARLQ